MNSAIDACLIIQCYTRLVNAQRLVNDFWVLTRSEIGLARFVLDLVRIQKSLTSLCIFTSLVHLTLLYTRSCPKSAFGHRQGNESNMHVQRCLTG